MKPTSFSYESMGTHWEISIWDKLGKKEIDDLRDTIISKSKAFDQAYSRFKDDSFVSSISKKIGAIEVPKDFVEMLRIYKDLYLPSEKMVNPLIGNAISDLGYDSKYSFTTKSNPSAVPDLEENVEIINDEKIYVKSPVLFDFGALGKGYFVDKIAHILMSSGIKRYLVNGSGDIYYEGNGESIKVGLEHPDDTTKVIGSIDINRGSICASAGNRRKWGKLHHIINPKTLAPADYVIATWIMADTAALADGLATALFFTPPESFSGFKFEYLLLNKEYKVKKSKGFSADLY